MQVSTRLSQAVPPGLSASRPEAAAPPSVPDRVVLCDDEPSRLGKWARTGLLAAGITTAAAGVLGYAAIHQPNPLDACQSPEIEFEQQVDRTTYEIDLDQGKNGLARMCVDGPGSKDYSITFEDGSYRVQTNTFYRDYAVAENVGVAAPDYAVPHEDTHGLVPADESARWPLASSQERALEEAWAQRTEELGNLKLETGVGTFPNSQAAPEELLATRLTVDGHPLYTLNDSSGNGLILHSQTPWDHDQALDAVARVADYRATVPDHLQPGVTSVEFRDGPKPGVPWSAATYYDKDQVVFWNGTDNLSERVFVHELGHGVGFDAARATRGPWETVKSWVGEGTGVPEGWEDAMREDGHAVSSYAHRTKREDFAETFLAYLDAREHGAQSAFAESFPHRTEILAELLQS